MSGVRHVGQEPGTQPALCGGPCPRLHLDAHGHGLFAHRCGPALGRLLLPVPVGLHGGAGVPRQARRQDARLALPHRHRLRRLPHARRPGPGVLRGACVRPVRRAPCRCLRRRGLRHRALLPELEHALQQHAGAVLVHPGGQGPRALRCAGSVLLPDGLRGHVRHPRRPGHSHTLCPQRLLCQDRCGGSRGGACKPRLHDQRQGGGPPVARRRGHLGVQLRHGRVVDASALQPQLQP